MSTADDRFRISHARRADDADGAGAAAVEVGRGDQAERPQFRIAVLGADHDGEAGAVEILVQHAHQALLLFDHPPQRLQRRRRNAAGLHDLFDQRRGAVNVDGGRPIEVLERGAGQAQREAEQLIVERAFFLEPIDDAGAHFIERAAAEFGVEIIRGLHQLRRRSPFRRCPPSSA